MPDRTAPLVFVSYAHESPDHEAQVRRLATFLRARIGLDVQFDQWADNKRIDWSIWAMNLLTEADYIVVVGSPEFRRRAEGTAPPDEGRGAQFEAMIMRNNITKDIRRETERILPVLLPGRTVEDLPVFLAGYSTTRFKIHEISDEGVQDLVAAITGVGRHPMPRRGEWLGGQNNRRTLFVNGMRWTVASPHIRADSAQIDGVRYENSIVLRPSPATSDSHAFVEIDLGGAYCLMTSVVGVPDDAAETFQVGHFRVCVDGDPRHEGKVALGKSATIKVDVTGAQRLRLEMSRPGAAASPLLADSKGAVALPELAWGDPSLY
ncbi:SEFIR domain-containing protein [Kibdelosporangium persicum]|uniref:SEFIR domain-containing protein n=1 Tax=Kibdelosporangium persicum TaxID=2698649 RepID=A0ABX2FIE9_9PSEU|nr:SEFIR domain-containing protein [Kibdelosporangium persicum]NRN70595.1 SEFIR domain-containing protein [Kibdelosporangium persicum]